MRATERPPLYRILAVAGDPGGAAALAPVVAHLRGRGDVDVRAIAYLNARDVWAACGVSCERIDDARLLDPAAELRRSEPSLVMVGTSVNEINLEKAFLTAANRAMVPSIAIMDYWANYRARFACDDGSLILPLRIAVMDDRARREMMDAGFPESSLVVTGQPALSQLSQNRPRLLNVDRQKIRKAYGIAENERLVLFASQPLSSGPADWGYSESTVIPQLVAALAQIGRRRNERLHLMIRPHPKEAAREWGTPGDGFLVVRTVAAGDGRQMALAADLVAGMTTVLLVEACLLGCVVVSLQPGLCEEDPLPTNRLGITKAVYSNAGVEPAIEELLFSSAARSDARSRCRGLAFPDDATANIERLIFAVIDNERAAFPRGERR